MSALEAIAHPVGMQAQAPFAPYYGLWSRLDAFTGEELSGLLTSRKAARIVLMRGTIHLVTAKDCHRLRPLVQPALDRMWRTNATHGKPLPQPAALGTGSAAGTLAAQRTGPADHRDGMARQAPRESAH